MGRVKPHEPSKTVRDETGENEVSQSDAELANQALCALNEILDERQTASREVDVTIEGHTRIVRLPRGLGETLRQILANTAAGRGVVVMPNHAELTTQQAADMLQVSRPYLIKLVKEGVIECRMVGTHRRIQAASLHDYQRKTELDSKKAADELAELTEELELY